MTHNKIHAFSLAAVLVFCGIAMLSYAPQAGAQGVPSSTPQTAKIIKTQFEVLHMLYQSLQVRSLTDMRELHTFTYAPEIRDKMQTIFNDGGYQFGDKVVVWYRQGTAIALNIKGKPSKAK
jgi:hypothetical protein